MDLHIPRYLLAIMHSSLDMRIRDAFERYAEVRKTNPRIAAFMEEDDDVRRLLEQARANLESQCPELKRVYTSVEPAPEFLECEPHGQPQD